MFRILIRSVFMLLLTSESLLAADYYVRTGGSDTNPGSASLPFRTITRALSVADAGDAVRVGAGTYDLGGGEAMPIVMKSGVTLISESGPEVTIVDAASGTRVFLCNANVAGTRIEGFTITGGAHTATDATDGGAGILIRNGDSTTISRNIIRDNQLNGAAGASGFAGVSSCGGGIYANGSAPLIVNNVIQSNFVYGGTGGPGGSTDPGGAGGSGLGGGLCSIGSTGNGVFHNTFYGNRAYGGEGGSGSSTGNGGAGSGGGMYSDEVAIANNIFALNWAVSGSGGSPPGAGGGGLLASSDTPPTNNLFFANNPNHGRLGTNPIVDRDPLFLSAPGDLDLDAGSPSRGAGFFLVVTHDLDRIFRPVPPSIGAFEPPVSSICLEELPQTIDRVLEAVSFAVRSREIAVVPDCSSPATVACPIGSADESFTFAVAPASVNVFGDAEAGFSFSAEVELTTPRAIPFEFSGASCTLRITSEHGVSETVQVSGDVVFQTSKRIELVALSASGIESVDVEVGGGFLCYSLSPSFLLGFPAEVVQDAMRNAMAPDLCRECGRTISACPPPVRGDLNDDANPDLLWRNYATGAVNAWFLKGTAYAGGASMFTVASADWRLEGMGDFNVDTSTDLIWRNYATGAVNVWYLNGSVYVGGTSLFSVTDLNWEIDAVGDFNGDRLDDLIWRNYATGEVNVWFLHGPSYAGGASLFTVADENWRIEVAGDFNGDGKTDLIWRNYATGAVNVWFLDGTAYIGGASLFTVPDPTWKIEATADYDGDGRLDLIWRNYATGAVNVWFLNGTAYVGGASLFTVASPSWEIAGPR